MEVRIDAFPVPAYFIMKVITGTSAGIPHISDDLSPLYALTSFYCRLKKMTIDGLIS
jgi:hypothetical protein